MDHRKDCFILFHFRVTSRSVRSWLRTRETTTKTTTPTTTTATTGFDPGRARYQPWRAEPPRDHDEKVGSTPGRESSCPEPELWEGEAGRGQPGRKLFRRPRGPVGGRGGAGRAKMPAGPHHPPRSASTTRGGWAPGRHKARASEKSGDQGSSAAAAAVAVAGRSRGLRFTAADLPPARRRPHATHGSAEDPSRDPLTHTRVSRGPSLPALHPSKRAFILYYSGTREKDPGPSRYWKGGSKRDRDANPDPPRPGWRKSRVGRVTEFRQVGAW